MTMATGGLSTARLLRMHDVLAGYVDRGQLPGLVTAISRRGEIHVDAIGTLAVDGGARMGRDTIFRVSSMTKPVAAAAAMVLVEECRLRLDDPVDVLLPELADRRVLRRLDGPLDDTVPADRPITVRDLLTFRLGYGMVLAPPDAYPILRAANDLRLGAGPPHPESMPEPDEWLRRFGSLPLMYQPGERWQYNTGADILGVLLARAAGQPLEKVLADRVLAPLGMRDTAFAVEADRADRLASSYLTDPATGGLTVYDQGVGGAWTHPPEFPSAAGGLVSTVDDFLAFGTMMLAGGKGILSRPSVALMTTDHLTPAQKEGSGLSPGFFDSHGWGFGMSVRTRRDDLESVGTFGWDGGLGTTWYCDPREDLVLILMTQRSWTSPVQPPIVRDFLTSVYQAIDD
jgi:CubicO group peptidase (beta-lactamase class C family)